MAADGSRWQLVDGKMQMIKHGWKNADGKLQMEKCG